MDLDDALSSRDMIKAKLKSMAFCLREVPESIAKIIRLLGFWDYFSAG